MAPPVQPVGAIVDGRDSRGRVVGPSDALANLPLSSPDLPAATTWRDQANAVATAARQQVADLDQRIASLDAADAQRQAADATRQAERAQVAASRDQVSHDVREIAVASFTTDHSRLDDLTTGASPSVMANEQLTTTLASGAIDVSSRRLSQLDHRVEQLDRQIAADARAHSDNRRQRDGLVAQRPQLTAAAQGASLRASAAGDTAGSARSAATVGGTNIPLVALDAYWRAAEMIKLTDPTCRLQWWGLAGIGFAESSHGHSPAGYPRPDGSLPAPIVGIALDGTSGTRAIRDTDHGVLDGDTKFDRAVGPMQFLPGTWRRWGADGSGDHVADPQNMYDAALTAARYMCSGGGQLDTDPGLMVAYRRYNNDPVYVQQVLAWGHSYQVELASLST
jgi:membrane-bound lytic murein transglycosylase B